MDIAIIGGGASGLAAAIAACENSSAHVTVLERQARVGKKLLATGNGRCNLSNTGAGPAHYHGTDVSFTDEAFRQFDPAETLRWFDSLGLAVCTEPSGRVYPISDMAGSVVDTLRLAAQALGVELRCGFDAAGAAYKKGRFSVWTRDDEKVIADRLIIACGGPAGTKLGGTGAGHEILSSFGHSCTPLYPALVQLVTDNTWTRSLKGIRTQAVVTLERDREVLARSQGEVQFTDYGISGPAIFDISRTASADGGGAAVYLDLLPDMDACTLTAYFDHKTGRFPDYRAENLLTGLLHNGLSRVLLRRSGILPEFSIGKLTGGEIGTLTDNIRRFSLPLIGTRGFSDAQVTAGGIRTDEFNPKTMESRLIPGLYACGEVLDIDGDCGGFNLQWAWSAGRLAGTSAINRETWREEP